MITLDINPSNFDHNNPDHIDYVIKHLEYYSESDLECIYNIADGKIKEHCTELFFTYNIKDVDLVEKIEQKRGILKQMFFLAFDAQINFDDTLGTVKPWDVIITNYLMDQKIAVPAMKVTEEDINIMGGHVKEPKIGLSEWVVTFDYTSLYPKIIESVNISPDTFYKKLDFPIVIVDGDRSINVDKTTKAINEAKAKMDRYSIAANGCLFDREKQGFLPALMERMYKDRLEAQNKLKIARKELQMIDQELARRGINV